MSDLKKRLKNKEIIWSPPMSYRTYKNQLKDYTKYFEMNKKQLHCVGTNTLEDFDDDFSDIKNNIHFYGSQKSEFFPAFFQKMDMALAPNRVNILDKGAFDGFPLMSEAGFFGVPIFCTDELGLNHNYIDKQDLVIIKPELTNICKSIEYYINNLEELKEIGFNGKSKIQNYFNLEKQQSDRLKFINNFIDLDYNEEKK